MTTGPWTHKVFQGEPFATHDGCMQKAHFHWRHFAKINGPAWCCGSCDAYEPATKEEIEWQEAQNRSLRFPTRPEDIGHVEADMMGDSE